MLISQLWTGCWTLDQVSAMDEGVGNITRALYDTGLADNTVVVFSSDNGGNVNCVNHLTSSNYPLRGGKR